MTTVPTSELPSYVDPTIQVIRKTTTTTTTTRRIQRIKPGPPSAHVGLLLSGELDKARERCKMEVREIARECRDGNRKYRDREFDLLDDQERCIYGLTRAIYRSAHSDPANSDSDSDSSSSSSSSSSSTSSSPQAPSATTSSSKSTTTPSSSSSPSSSLEPPPPSPPKHNVLRITDIFPKPLFFKGGPRAGDVLQGELGDCWLLSALACVATSKGLVEGFCVARDEEVGVYGFVFFRNGRWESVIIDDFLLWSLPKFEQLTPSEQLLYHNSKFTYTSSISSNSARGRGLLYAQSGLEGETWVPLAEKAYAKMRGDYASLEGGFVHEGIEDLTGGTSVVYLTSDILDPDRFWTEELLHASKDRLFSCTLTASEETQGLLPYHGYSLLRAKECRGMRFVVIRNPWGDTEWTGAWSDGSSMWTTKGGSKRGSGGGVGGSGEGEGEGEEGEEEWTWNAILEDLDHTLGNDGQFIMSYPSFLSTFSRIARTSLFTSSHTMSSHFLALPPRPLLHPWAFGDVNFYFEVVERTPATIVLSKLDEGGFRDVAGRSEWGVDFVVYKRGEEYGYRGKSGKGEVKEERSGATISPSFRDATCEIGMLDVGEYVVYARVDRFYGSGVGKVDLEEAKYWDERKLGRVLTQQVQAYSLATNFDTTPHALHIPRSVSHLINEEGKEKDAPASLNAPPATPTPLSVPQQSNPIDSKPTNADAKSTKTIKTTATTLENLHMDERPPFLGLKIYTKRGCIVGAITSEIRDFDY